MMASARASYGVRRWTAITADGYDLVTIFEGLQDMSCPVDALRAARRMLRDGGSVLVAAERVDDEFTPPAPVLERHAYGWSVI
jgi:ubiquinone/menaquinone biosynthesis C-methylase UbiE